MDSLLDIASRSSQRVSKVVEVWVQTELLKHMQLCQSHDFLATLHTVMLLCWTMQQGLKLQRSDRLTKYHTIMHYVII